MGSKGGYLKYRGEGTHEGGRGDPCKEGEEAPMAGVVGTYGGHHMGQFLQGGKNGHLMSFFLEFGS